LMARDQRKRGVGQLAFDDVKIRPADPADGNANQDLSRPWLWYWKLARLERGGSHVRCASQDHRLHD